jgi:membrane protein
MGVGFAAEVLRRARTPTVVPKPWRWSDGPIITIPAGGWLAILKAAFDEFNRDRIPAVAAGVAYYSVLALFPGLAAFVAFYGLFGDVDDARRALMLLTGIAPPATLQFIGDEMVRIATIHHAQLSVTFAVGMVVSIWSANAAMSALLGGLNVAYEQAEQRGFLLATAESLGFTIGGIVLALAASTVFLLAPRAIYLFGPNALTDLAPLRWPVLVALVMGILSVLYRFGPSRPRAHWRWVTPGSAFAAIMWLLASLLFSSYVGAFGHYDRTYGPLAAVVGFMVWLWLSVIVILFGAELNNEIERPRTSPKPGAHHRPVSGQTMAISGAPARMTRIESGRPRRQ